MRSAYVSLILAAGLAAAGGATASWAQAPATTAPAPTPTPAGAPPAGPAPTTSAAPLSQTSPVAPAAPATPAGAAPQGAPAPAATPEAPPAPEPPAIPTAGDGAVLINVLEKICVPQVRGQSIDQLAPALGMRKNRRDNTWSMPLGGDKNYTVTIWTQGVNKDVCQAEIHFAVGQDAPIAKAINIWSFLHKPELILQANYVAVDADGVKRVRKSWEHLESASSTAVNFTTWRKPDDSPLNKNYDTGILYYQERKF
jgi:hypothetical protein